jgi:hypothetical protein
LLEKTIQRPFGEKLCHEFMSFVLHRISRASPPSTGTIQSRLSGRISWPFRHLTKTTHFPSGETFGNVLLIPLADAPSIGSGVPPLPPSNGIR